MSVLIKMELPNCCAECPLEQCEENYYGDIMNRECCLIYKGYTSEYSHKRREDCPLVEIKPHGRLIDADAIPYIFGSTHATDYDTVTKFVINRLPTIIGREDGT